MCSRSSLCLSTKQCWRWLKRFPRMYSETVKPLIWSGALLLFPIAGSSYLYQPLRQVNIGRHTPWKHHNLLPPVTEGHGTIASNQGDNVLTMYVCMYILYYWIWFLYFFPKGPWNVPIILIWWEMCYFDSSINHNECQWSYDLNHSLFIITRTTSLVL